MSILPSLLMDMDETVAATDSFDDVEEATAYGRTLAFDWTTLRFRRDGLGRLLVVSGQRALLEDVVKVLLTPRWRYVYYSPDYGSELQDGLIGQPEALVRTKLPALIEEALMGDPRIQGVENVSIRRASSNGLYVRFSVRDFNGLLLRVPEVVIPLG